MLWSLTETVRTILTTQVSPIGPTQFMCVANNSQTPSIFNTVIQSAVIIGPALASAALAVPGYRDRLGGWARRVQSLVLRRTQHEA